MGALIGAISGMILSIWLGVKITDGTITPYYAGSVRSNHYEFRSEPGKGIIGSLLGVFDAFWAIAYMLMAIGLTALPLDNAFHISNLASPDQGFTHMTYGLIQATGVLFSYFLLADSIDKSNNGVTNLLDVWRQFDPQITDMSVLIWDWIMIQVSMMAYFGVAGVTAGGAFYYVYLNVAP